MRSKVLLLFGFLSILQSDILSEFKNRNYEYICNFNNINTLKDEKILSLVGISCVKSDRLYLLPFIIRKLKKTKIGRLNSIYLLTIYMQKKLLYSYFFDKLNLDNFNLPDTDYILSHIFYKIKNNDFKKDGDIYIIKYADEIIKVYTQEDKLIVEEYKNNQLIKRRWFR